METMNVQGLVAAIERLASVLEARAASQETARVYWPEEEGLAYWYRRVGGRLATATSISFSTGPMPCFRRG